MKCYIRFLLYFLETITTLTVSPQANDNINFTHVHLNKKIWALICLPDLREGSKGLKMPPSAAPPPERARARGSPERGGRRIWERCSRRWPSWTLSDLGSLDLLDLGSLDLLDLGSLYLSDLGRHSTLPKSKKGKTWYRWPSSSFWLGKGAFVDWVGFACRLIEPARAMLGLLKESGWRDLRWRYHSAAGINKLVKQNSPKRGIS